jgi:hypothetical protein
MNDHISFKLKVRGVGYDQIKPMMVTSDALLDALKILDVEPEAYADAQAQAIADLYYDASDHVEMRWGWVNGGSGHYFYPRCPDCKKTRNFCVCSYDEDLRARVAKHKMGYGDTDQNKSIYLASAFFDHEGYTYLLMPADGGGLYAEIFTLQPLTSIAITPNFHSAWDTHKAAEIMINDLTKGDPNAPS